MSRQKKRMCVRLLFMSLLLVLSGFVLFWQTDAPTLTGEHETSGVQQSETSATYTKKELEAEAERTYGVLKQYGIRVYGGAASVHNNAVKLFIDPRDKVRLDVTQEGVPNKHYYRLIRKSSAVPVYIAFEGPYVNPIGID